MRRQESIFSFRISRSIRFPDLILIRDPCRSILIVHKAPSIKTADIGEVNVYNLLKAVKEKFPKVVEGFEDLI